MDNCTAQNKNWSLLTSILNLVKTDAIAAETVTFKFLEAGHTFMSADGVHAQVEKRIKQKKEVYNFDDILTCVDIPNREVKAIKRELFELTRPSIAN